jgi:hypothetical protein
MTEEQKVGIDLRREFRGGFRKYNYEYREDVINHTVKMDENLSHKTFESF